MSRFNTAVKPRKADTVNLAGGEAFSQSAELELASLLLTSLVRDEYYESAEDNLDRLSSLLTRVDPVFAAKAAIYARREFGMRSITHAAAGEVAHRVKGEEWTRPFFARVVRRPDDITEILSYYIAKYGREGLPNSLKDGLGRAFAQFDRYQLAKYKGERKSLTLRDAVLITHPEPVERNKDALKALLDGTLKSEKTWEAKLSAAGQSENKEKAKADAWADLVRNGTIGYFALLRNLRNIQAQNPDLISDAAKLLVNEKAIRKSLIFPFNFLTALQEVSDRTLVSAINRAIDISLANVPRFDGKTLVVIDHSGSMGTFHPGSRKYIGDLFAAAMFKANDADVMVFGDDAGYVNGLNPDDTVTTIAQAISRVSHGHGTSFPSIFAKASKKYDRIVLFSDMQGWAGYNYYGGTPEKAFADYRKAKKANPHVYSVDLAGYGTMQFPESRVYALAGFSEKIFDIMQALEADPKALVTKINEVKL